VVTTVHVAAAAVDRSQRKVLQNKTRVCQESDTSSQFNVENKIWAFLNPRRSGYSIDMEIKRTDAYFYLL
jgi:hypothetical protein